MPHHPLTTFEIRKYYQIEPKFNGFYPRNNLSKKKDGTHVINLDVFKSVGTYWISLYVNAKNVTYFDKKCMVNKNIKTNIYRI